ncbi:MAG: ATP synthase F0 subunit A [Verrucomicrobiales bacterium]|nr:ATP synthase F0 subunit A [Verrucomicrobiales bacterium]
MWFSKKFVIFLALIGLPGFAAAKGLPAAAPVLTPESSFFQINSSMVVIWIVAIGLIIVAQLATRNVALVPSGLQNFVEWLVEGMYGVFEDIVGKHMIKKTFWFFCTIFIFILFSNWFGLVPGLGTIGWGHEVDGHFLVTSPILRGAHADLNMTAAMALLFFFLWTKWSLGEIGAGGMAGHIFAVKGHGGGFLGLFLVLVFVFVGAIEIVSICVRPVALMFRLYGNIFAGENILETVMHMAGPIFGGIAVFPFYLLEVLVGLVQALVFALLTAVFTSLMCEHHEEEH